MQVVLAVTRPPLSPARGLRPSGLPASLSASLSSTLGSPSPLWLFASPYSGLFPSSRPSLPIPPPHICLLSPSPRLPLRFSLTCTSLGFLPSSPSSVTFRLPNPTADGYLWISQHVWQAVRGGVCSPRPRSHRTDTWRLLSVRAVSMCGAPAPRRGGCGGERSHSVEGSPRPRVREHSLPSAVGGDGGFGRAGAGWGRRGKALQADGKAQGRMRGAGAQ